MPFTKLGLSDKVLAAVTAAGYTTPTPIQEQAIPHVLARRDVLGIAQTGTGKTAAFTLPMLTMLENGRARARMPRTLILEPTRELAAQVEESFIKYGAKQKLNVALIIGGVSFDDQDMKLTRGVDVLIATPGRLLDHYERGRLLLTGVDLLVIDEADRMLDMGFIPDIERICKLVPFTRQTLFFTATMPPEIRRITEQFLHNPVKVEVAKPATTVASITQRLVKTGREPHDKRDTLRQLIRTGRQFQERDRVLQPQARSRATAQVAAAPWLQCRRRCTATSISRHARRRSNSFRKGEVALLIASDVAARGLDIPAVSHVFNFDVPHHADDYVHRIGRTGRAGLPGTAITIVAPADSKSVAAIEKLTGQSIPWMGEPTRSAVSEAAAPAHQHREESEQAPAREHRGGRAPQPAQPQRDRHMRPPMHRHTANARPHRSRASKKPAPGASRSRPAGVRLTRSMTAPAQPSAGVLAAAVSRQSLNAPLWTPSPHYKYYL